MAVQNENVAINIASSFDAKGFKEAETATTKLTKSVKNLAFTLGVAFSAQAVANFGKQSVQAFLKDEEAATRLSQAVKNLGMEFANPYIADYIKKLEQTSKVADDQLRPAFQSLLQQTGSLTDSQKILSTAIETSRGSGVDLATVANDLAQAYVGNTKGLKKYYLGLTNAQLKAKSFVEIQKIMNDQFSGSSAAYLATYSGQVGVLSLSWQNFQEKVGGALLTLASFGDGADGHKLNLLAATLDKIGSAIELIAKGKETIFNLFNLTGKGGLLEKFNPYATGGASTTKPDKTVDKYAELLAKIEADRKKQNEAIVKANKDQAAQLKKQQQLKKQNLLIDINAIELVAALKGKLSDQDRKVVELQLALLTENDQEAAKLSMELANSIDKTGQLSRWLQTLPDAKNPFAGWQAYLDSLKLPAWMTTSAMNPEYALTPATSIQSQYGGNFLNATGGYAGTSPTPNVTVQIDGKAIASAIQDQSLNGNQSVINRAVGDFSRVTNL